MSPFQIRTDSLKELGFGKYSEYTKSGMWSNIRKLVLGIKGPECSCCNQVANSVHHTAYDINTMRGTCYDHLHPLCQRCHFLIEIKCSGTTKEKRNWNDSLAMFRSLRSKKHEAPPRLDPATLPASEEFMVITWDNLPEILTELNGLTFATADVLGLPIPLVSGWKLILVGKHIEKSRWALAKERKHVKANAWRRLKKSEPEFPPLKECCTVYCGDFI